MQSYTLTHLSDAALLHDLEALAVRESVATAMLLAHIAEADARKLYVPAGFPSMFAYCLDKLHLSEDAAYHRIRAARTARQFPVLFTAIAEGRLHLTAVCLLAPHLTAENVDELIDAATHRRKTEVEELVGSRFSGGRAPAREIVPTIRALPRPAPADLIDDLLAPERMETPGQSSVPAHAQLIPERVQGDGQLVPERVASDETHGQLVPERVESGQRFLVQVAISKSTHDKLRYLQTLLSHSVPGGDLAQVLDRALDALIARLEKRKFGAAARRPALERSGAGAGAGEGEGAGEGAGEGERAGESAGSAVHDVSPARVASLATPHLRKRYIPARIRRAVWERDRGQCTFVSATGDRCAARSFLEFDHAEPVARGGKASVETIRLRCRAHNQYEAERTFGSAFMKRKRRRVRA